MTSVPYVHRPGSPSSKLSAGGIMVDILPVELCLKVYEFVYADLTSELSDNLFGVSLYDFLYDYTRPSLESHVGKTGLTALLYTCKKVHDEALEILCRHAEFVLNIMGDDDNDYAEQKSSGSPNAADVILEFVKSFKVNLEPLSDASNGRFVNRIHRFLEMINYGANVRSLKIRITGPSLTNPESLNQIIRALSKLHTPGNRVGVYLGEVTEELLSADSLDLFLNTINGHYDDEEDNDD
ncbi:hypothetical protein F5B21DRAFT_519285 [Xylaria acuta]|nr:hypothetical protein F5B21DRAFT_519285 [Xylaria acuta]